MYLEVVISYLHYNAKTRVASCHKIRLSRCKISNQGLNSWSWTAWTTIPSFGLRLDIVPINIVPQFEKNLIIFLWDREWKLFLPLAECDHIICPFFKQAYRKLLNLVDQYKTFIGEWISRSAVNKKKLISLIYSPQNFYRPRSIKVLEKNGFGRDFLRLFRRTRVIRGPHVSPARFYKSNKSQNASKMQIIVMVPVSHMAIMMLNKDAKFQGISFRD